MIFYFSATGNSFYAAVKLQAALQDDLVDITDAIRKNEYQYRLAKNEKVGFVFPVYFFGVPTIVGDFVRRLSLAGNKETYIYSVSTHRGNIGAVDKQFASLLAENGCLVTVSFSLPMISNYVLSHDITSLAEQESALISADRQLKTISGKISRSRTDGYVSGVKEALKTAVVYPVYKYGRRTSKFYAEDSCTGCGFCEDICPCDAIRITGGKPEWVAGQCIHCLGCINRCPLTAIQYGTATKQRGRFVNPILKN